MPSPSAIDGLHLCDAAIYKQFRSRDVAGIVGREKDRGLHDFIRCTEPAERTRVKIIFLRCSPVSEEASRSPQSGRVDGAWA
jgi:hypothetical protein